MRERTRERGAKGGEIFFAVGCRERVGACCCFDNDNEDHINDHENKK